MIYLPYNMFIRNGFLGGLLSVLYDAFQLTYLVLVFGVVLVVVNNLSIGLYTVSIF